MNDFFVSNILSLSVVVVAAARLHTLVGLAGLAIATECIKRLVGTNAAWKRRPAKARGCDIWCLGGAVGGRAGWPSGHVAVATAFVCWTAAKRKSGGRIWVWIWLVAVAWARWVKRCHTVGQIAAGGALGALVGLAFRRWAPLTDSSP